ncbi:MAG: YaaA family protein [Acidimicrobiia bacterium]
MTTALTVLLPPSEGKAEGGRGRFAFRTGAFTQLAKSRQQVADALSTAARGPGAAKLLGASGATLERAVAADSAIKGAPVLPAGERYTGVVWEHLDLESLGKGAQTRANDSIVVVSGLLGLVGVTDPVPDYRLKMGASLPPFGKLSKWWRSQLTDALIDRVTGGVVLDLLPKEHADALDRALVAAAAKRFVRVEFVKAGGGAAGHNAKAVKGLVARAAVSAAPARLVQVLESFSAAGPVLGAWSCRSIREDDGVTCVEIAGR